MVLNSHTLSPKELGEAIGVSQSTLKRWVDAGHIAATRTEGGHRRIAVAEAIRFIRERGLTIQAPQMLGLPDGVTGGSPLDGAYDTFLHALQDGRGDDVSGILLSSYINGESVAAVCDTLVAPAMHHIGELWTHGPEGILIEHRATSFCAHALHQIRALIPAPPPGAPVAVGGGPSLDIYILPSVMAATVLAEVGWHAVNFGADTPLNVLAQAARDSEADLVWLAITVEQPKAAFSRELAAFASSLREQGVALILGGQAHEDVRLPSGQHVHTGKRMADLEAFGRGFAHALQRRS